MTDYQDRIQQFENKLIVMVENFHQLKEQNRLLIIENAELKRHVEELQTQLNNLPNTNGVIEEYNKKIDSYINLIDATIEQINQLK